SLGAWISPAVTMTQAVPALTLSFAIPGVAVLSGLLTRWRHRGYFALLVGIGLVISVGSHPWDHPSLYGRAFRLLTTTESGLAFRSTPRAAPLVVLGLAVFLGAGVAAVTRARPSLHLPVSALLLLAVCLNASPLFRGQMVDRNLDRPERIPAYWTRATDALSRGSRSHRIYELPGTDFTSYRWGNTVDPITPGLTDREYAARELIPYGTPLSANLLNAWDSPLQQGAFDPSTLAPIARLLGVDTIVHRGDLDADRFRTPRARPTYRILSTAPGLGRPTTYGPRRELSGAAGYVDGTELADPSSDETPPAVSRFPVRNTRPVARTVDATAPVLLDGDGSGLVALAAAGGLQPDRPVLYGGTLVRTPSLLASSLSQRGASIVVTDTNRRQARRWGTVRDNDGYTERAGETALVPDDADNRLDLFPGTGDSVRTVAVVSGPVTARSSRYGNPVSYTAADRPMNAVDGDTGTAWRTAAFARAEGEFLELRFRRPVTTDELFILQNQRRGNRWITELGVSFDGGPQFARPLGEQSFRSGGQRLRFPAQTFRTVRLQVRRTNLGPLSSYLGVSDVGIAEITVPGVTLTSREIIQLPTALLDEAGRAAKRLPLQYIFTRRWSDPADTMSGTEELVLRRRFQVPSPRAFTPFGKVRLAAGMPDERVDATLGLADAESGGLTAQSSGYLDGVPAARAGSAVDGDVATAWTSPFGNSTGRWIDVRYGAPVTLDTLSMEVVADGRHSVPTVMTLRSDSGDRIEIKVPAVRNEGLRSRGATTVVTVPLGPTTGTRFRLTIDAIAAATNRYGTPLPVAIAELGLPVRPPITPGTPVPDECRTDVFRTGSDTGLTVPVRIVGTVDDALRRAPLRLESCGTPLALKSGTNTLVGGSGRAT
ncbi:MAG: alpha-(1-_3)-arabinofuranosyltransferase family protein, partial [Actinomycetes bacterium]